MSRGSLHHAHKLVKLAQLFAHTLSRKLSFAAFCVSLRLTMLSRMSSTLALRASRSLARPAAFATSRQSFATMGEVVTADDSWKKSCYNGFDYTINDQSTVYEAVQKLAAFDIGCLVTVDDEGALVMW